MSIHSDLMRSGADLLTALQGDAEAVKYKPPDGTLFIWTGASAGTQQGGYQHQDNGDVLRVTRCVVQGPTAVLLAKGVREIEREAVLAVWGLDWSIDAQESQWGPLVVRLGLVRRPIARHQELDDRAAVRR